jgi:ParB family protein
VSAIRAYLKGLVEEAKSPATSHLPLEALLPSPQPRRRFENLEALAESIREKGVLQPLLVRPLGDGRYAIVAGERRYRAAKMAGLAEVPVRVLDLPEKEARLLALVENLQREDLNPYEETLGVLELLSEDLGKTREEVVSLLERMRKEKRGVAAHNVMGTPEAQRVEEVFQALGRMTWESFVRTASPS